MIVKAAIIGVVIGGILGIFIGGPIEMAAFGGILVSSCRLFKR